MEKSAFIIPYANLATLSSKIAKIAKKAKKITGNADSVGFEIVGEPYYVKKSVSFEPGSSPVEVKVKMVKINVWGDSPVIEGHQILGKIEYLNKEGKFLIHGNNIDPETVPEKPYCDHCQTFKPKVKVFGVKEIETGKKFFVGGGCLKDFKIEASATQIANYLTSIEELFSSINEVEDDSLGGFFAGGYWDAHFDSIDFLAVVDHFATKYGYVTKTQAYNECVPSTTDLVNEYFSGKAKNPVHWDEIVTPEAKVKAKNTLDYILSADLGSGEFTHNIKVLATLEAVPVKQIGILGYSWVLYQKHLEKLEKEKLALTTPSEYLGEVGGKISVEKATLTFKKAVEGYYGTSYIHKFLDTEGNILTWFASNNNKGLEIGDVATFGAKVKKHDEFKGEKSTVISYLSKFKVLEKAEDAA